MVFGQESGMASQKKKAATQADKRETNTDGGAKFPYTTKPSSLRRLLKEIPKKPKPQRFTRDLFRSWGFKDTNDLTMVRVLKAVNLINDRNEPTDLYSRFMSLNDGGKSLGPEIKRIYAPLFQASHAPYQEGNEQLKNLFHINSGGSSLDYQIQTFKALCENAAFDQMGSTITGVLPGAKDNRDGDQFSEGTLSSNRTPIVNINLHIHLPENKTRRDYEVIIEDIGRYIFGRNTGERSD
jgi:hypothetical protein